MSTDNKPIVDPHTGTQTTGHVWDDIQELNTPLPRWWVWLFYATIVWSVGYWIVYPTWPLISSYTGGVFEWRSRNAIVEDLAALKARRGDNMAKLAAATPEQIIANPEMLAFARAVAKPVFAENCAPCHGAGGAGAKGYPNLNDDDWLWGGKLADIQQTILHGARSTDDKGHQGSMPAFGRDNMLKKEEIAAVADYARSLSGLPVEAGANLAAGQKLFADNCAACHGDDGKGNRELGAPNLTDKIWLYGSDKATIVEGITNGRGGVMPAWQERLDDVTVKALTVYVHTFGGGEK
ncbi:MAG: cytochrome-c oxidase, cbb3-type subunit III [Xanthobacteraceae bacterium]|nr:MAG: cytochrome-c oxidase, cbb3-type subunit III [Xanthobacteraceae bacterium]